jgi:hypothetical protein
MLVTWTVTADRVYATLLDGSTVVPATTELADNIRRCSGLFGPTVVETGTYVVVSQG